MRFSRRAFPKLPSLLLALLLAWSGTGRVQAQIYYPDLSKQAMDLPNRNIYIEQVVDGRLKRTGIGTVHRGAYNTPQQADLRPNVPQALTTWLQVQLPPRPTDHPVLLLVRELALAEVTSAFSEKATLNLAVDVYAQLPDGYHYLLSAAEQVEGKGLEVTARHPANLALALQRCLAQCKTVNWDQLPVQPAHTLAELQQLGRPAAPVLTYAALTDSIHPKGYYPDFLSFRNNQPVAAPDLSLEQTPRTTKGWEGTLEVVPTLIAAAGTREPLRKVWGFSDGRQQYIWHNRHFLPLTRDGNAFRFVGFAGADPGAVGTASYLAGPIGGAIATATTKDKPADYTLDLITGAISPFRETTGAAPADTALIYVYRRAGSSPTPVPVLLNGKVVAELGEWQSVSIPWTDKLHEVSLCLEAVPGRCTTFIPAFGRTAYVEIARNPTDPAKPPLEKVAVKKGVFDLRVIEARNKSTR